ncbi:MAG: hypothetical protein A4E66_02109 [Syntrophus sp. PtaB.Bin001]|nr:MAG: hypothetical protein A4E66_02109 [Syntrophus sp. PtaB.Bin001]
MAENLQDFTRHHFTESRSDPSLRNTLVGGVGAVAFAEDTATPRYLVGRFLSGEGNGFINAEPHAPNLLQKKFSCSRGAFVARLDRAYLAVLPDYVDQEGFSPCADYGVQGTIAVVDVRQGAFYRLGFGNRSEIHKMAEFSSCDGDSVVLPGRY